MLQDFVQKGDPEWHFHMAEIQLVYKDVNRQTFGQQHSPTYVENTFSNHMNCIKMLFLDA